MDICQSIVPSLVAEGQTLMINAQLVHQGGMEIMHRHLITDHRVAEVVGFTVDEPRLEAPPATKVVKQFAWWSRP